MLTGAIIGCVVALVIMFMNTRKAKSGTGLPGQIEQALQGKGPQTLREIGSLVGKDSFMGRDRSRRRSRRCRASARSRRTRPPTGTPQLKKVDFITYELVNYGQVN